MGAGSHKRDRFGRARPVTVPTIDCAITMVSVWRAVGHMLVLHEQPALESRMRIIVYGVGAIGGTIAVQLCLSGHQVIGIARGRQLEIVRGSGLTLYTPQATRTAKFAVCADPEEISFGAGDVVLLTMKGPDTAGALLRLKAAGVSEQPIFCFQNGVANEALALRFFENVYGATVMLPADYDTPGEVAAYFAPKIGAFDIGRYPQGSDEAVENLTGLSGHPAS